MKKIILCLVAIIAILSIVFLSLKWFNASDEANYTVEIVSYTTENASYVEYPQIIGLPDKQKQDEINQLLKDEVVLGAKTYTGETFVAAFPNIHYDYSSGVGLANKNIASFWYAFSAYGEVELEHGGWMRDTNRFFCITIDMNTGKEITLPDFLIIDERLINSNDGSEEKPDYNRADTPIFHAFKDAHMIYTNEDERDAYHIFSAQYIIESLHDLENETTWYIDQEKNIVFSLIDNMVRIPYTQLLDIIYPEYLAYLL